MNGNKGNVHFKFAHVLKLFCAMDHDGGLLTVQLNADKSTECERQIASGARLQRWCQREQEGRRSERTKVRQVRLDR